jgi:hypothetical protein
VRTLLFRLLATLVVAGAVRAQEKKEEPPAREPVREARHTPRIEPLSPEDAELVKELALLEKLELVKNLELFEEEPGQAPKQPQRQP